MKFKIGDRVYKPKGYKFPGIIVAIFQTTSGETRIVAEMVDNGMLHIFNESQLEKQTLGGGGMVTTVAIQDEREQ